MPMCESLLVVVHVTLPLEVVSDGDCSIEASTSIRVIPRVQLKASGGGENLQKEGSVESVFINDNIGMDCDLAEIITRTKRIINFNW